MVQSYSLHIALILTWSVKKLPKSQNYVTNKNVMLYSVVITIFWNQSIQTMNQKISTSVEINDPRGESHPQQDANQQLNIWTTCMDFGLGVTSA